MSLTTARNRLNKNIKGGKTPVRYVADRVSSILSFLGNLNKMINYKKQKKQQKNKQTATKDNNDNKQTKLKRKQENFALII